VLNADGWAPEPSASGRPDPDLAASPFTGYTRAHWEEIADRLLLSVRPYASPRHASIDLPGPVSKSGRWSDGLEGFARTFLMAAFRVAGAAGADPHGLIEWYARGFVAGVDPNSPERWPTLVERRQARVEAASIALGLHETRNVLWERLEPRTREQIVAWLAGVVGTRGYGNNWVWFQNVIEAFLRTVGGPWRPDDIEHNLALHESWHVGDGWYSDGGSAGGRLQNFDYYGGWALHFYALWYFRVLGEPPDARYLLRLRRYLSDVRHLIAADGAPLFQGRSLTYRFAMLAPFWAGAMFDATPLAPGATRRLASGVLRYFVEGGAVDERGLLPIGWRRRFPRMRQLYSGAGSPYWGSKGFAGLLLPPDHLVWTDMEAPLPVDRYDTLCSLRQPGWLVSSTAADGIVRIANHGSDHLPDRSSALDDPCYARHAYASHAAPEVDRSGLRDPLDSHAALLGTEGRASHRGRIDRVLQHRNLAVSRCRAVWVEDAEPGAEAAVWPSLRTGPWLTTASVLRGPVEVRIVRIGSHGPPAGEDPDAHWPADPGPWRLRIGGWALASTEDPPDAHTDGGHVTVRRDDGMISAIHPLRGMDSAGVSRGEEANPFGRHSATPWLATTGPVRTGEVYAAAIVLSGVADQTAGGIRVTVELDTVLARWPHGEIDVVPLGADGM
jgi:hypothetical protein